MDSCGALCVENNYDASMTDATRIAAVSPSCPQSASTFRSGTSTSPCFGNGMALNNAGRLKLHRNSSACG